VHSREGADRANSPDTLSITSPWTDVVSWRTHEELTGVLGCLERPRAAVVEMTGVLVIGTSSSGITAAVALAQARSRALTVLCSSPSKWRWPRHSFLAAEYVLNSKWSAEQRQRQSGLSV
jgi:hypothetical protein